MNFAMLPLAILVFLLPGYAWLVVLGLVRRLNVLGSVAFSFILSVCLLSLTSAFLSLLTPRYLVYTVAAAAIIPIIVIAACFQQQRFRWPTAEEPNTSSLLVLCFIVYLAFLLILFWSTPYYPTAPSTDFTSHAQITQDIFNGNGRSMLLHINYPVGLHFVAAITMELLGVNAIQSLRVVASIVLMTTPVLIFISARALLGNKNLAAVTTIVGALALPADMIHFVLIGTYPNILADAIVFAVLFLIFSYVKEPSPRVGVTLAVMGLAGTFIHSSFLLFLGVSWLALMCIQRLFIGKHDFARYLRACLFATSGVLLAALVALPLFERSMQRILDAYFAGATATWPQLMAILPIIYVTFAWNFVFLVKPTNLIAIGFGIIFIAMKQRRLLGQIYGTSWIILLVILAFVSGQTDRFVLFCMLPATFIVGNLVGTLPRLISSWKGTLSRTLTSRTIVPLTMLLLITTGGFLPLVSTAYNPASRVHEQDVLASMEWLKQNGCPGKIASIGLGLDYRYVQLLTGLQYSGDLPQNTPPDVALQKSATIGFGCLAIETDNQNFPSFELNQAFQEKYYNAEIAIFFICR
jgi:hypothetical protein